MVKRASGNGPPQSKVWRAVAVPIGDLMWKTLRPSCQQRGSLASPFWKSFDGVSKVVLPFVPPEVMPKMSSKCNMELRTSPSIFSSGKTLPAKLLCLCQGKENQIHQPWCAKKS